MRGALPGSAGDWGRFALEPVVASGGGVGEGVWRVGVLGDCHGDEHPIYVCVA